MSDYSQSIVDIEAKEGEARALARRVCKHLEDGGIVAAPKRGCVLSEEPGYPPGKKYAAACTTRAGRGFTRLVTNGMELVLERTVFDAGGNGLEIACPACKKKVLDPSRAWVAAVSAWWEGNDDAVYACPKCRKKAALNAWGGPFPWAFGSLGFIFWNWPPLKDSFVADVAKGLGHQVRVVRRRL